MIVSLGYESARKAGDPATVRDLQEMLSALGVSAATARPDQPLSTDHMQKALVSVRSTLPRFEVPEALLGDARIRTNPDTHNTAECAAQFLACKRECTIASPSVPLGHCFERCFFAFQMCRSHLSARPERR